LLDRPLTDVPFLASNDVVFFVVVFVVIVVVVVFFFFYTHCFVCVVKNNKILNSFFI